MDRLFGFASLVMATILGLFGSLVLQALLLRATFALMQPATADRRALRPPIERRTQLAVAPMLARNKARRFPVRNCRSFGRSGLLTGK